MTTSAQRHELAGHLLALRAAQVEGDRALVAGRHLPPQVHAVLRRAHLSAGVAVDRVLDVDDVGAEVGQQGAGQRAGDDVGELDDLEPGQGAAAGPPGCVVSGHVAPILEDCRRGARGRFGILVGDEAEAGGDVLGRVQADGERLVVLEQPC